jgi:predicted permease
MSMLGHNLRYGLRQLRKNPGFTLTALLCLSLGIGANTAVFSFLHAVLLERSPVASPGQLVRIFLAEEGGVPYANLSYPEYRDFREHSRCFSEVISETPKPFNLSAGGSNERIWGSVVSGNYFSGLGVAPILGRGFLHEEDATPGTHPVVVISHRLWRRRFDADPGILGRILTLNGHAFTVVGVAPPGWYGPNRGLEPELWAPLEMRHVLIPGSSVDLRGNHWLLFTIGRLRSGATIEQARAELEAILAGFEEQNPGYYEGRYVLLLPEREAGLHPMVRGVLSTGLGLVFGVVGILLLLACTNVAGLLLARSTARRTEIGIRMSLGASRADLIRLLMTENLILSLLAGLLGLAVGVGLARLIQSLQAVVDFPFGFRPSLDPWMLTFALAISLLSCLLFGLTPAWHGTRLDLAKVLKGAVTTGPDRALRLRNLLVTGQVALSMALLVAAGLALQSLRHAARIDVGFEAENQLVASVDLDLQGYDAAAGRRFVEDLRRRVGALPGVETVGFGNVLPLSFAAQQVGFRPEGYESPPGRSDPSIEYNVVDSGYFAAMGIPILRGRELSPEDALDSPPVMVVNETLVRQFWPGEDPIGRQARVGGRWVQVIGIAKNGKYLTLGEVSKPCLYLALAQHYTGVLNLHVRTAGHPGAFLEKIRGLVEDLDPALPVYNLMTMKEHLVFALLPARMTAGSIGAFAVLALLLAGTGLFGVIAYSVSRRVREIGIRMALGARPVDVSKEVVGRSLRLTGAGLLAGSLIGFVLGRLMSAIFYNVAPTDLVSFAGAWVVLLITALLAGGLPALRASRIDPAEMLRNP